MSLRIIDFGDVHISDQPPNNRVPGYREQIFAKLEEIGRICRANPENVDTTIALLKGDLFHQKRPSFVSHYLVGQLQQIFWQYGCDVYILPGNHDMGPGQMEGLRRQPLAVLDGGPVHVIAPGITDAPPILVTKDAAFIWRPYNVERDADPTYYELDATELLIAEKAPHTVMVAHGSIILPDDERPYPTVKLSDINLEGIDVLTTGHLHEDLGITLHEGTWFINTGCIGRTQRTEANLARKSIDVVSMILTDGIPTPSIQRIPLISALPPDEVFYEKILEEEAPLSDDIIDFAERLAAAADQSEEDIPIDQILEGLNVKDSVKKRIRTYLGEAGL